MDPNPKTYPILSYVLSKLPSLRTKLFTDDFDVEQPPPSSDASTSASPSFELAAQMPHLSDPRVIASMRFAVSEVAQTRSILQTLGARPDHESVDIAKAKLAQIESGLSKQLEEIVRSPRPAEVDRLGWRAHLADKEKEVRQAAEREKQVYKAVIQLDEMHGAYEKLLKGAEEKLVRIYESVAEGCGDGGIAAAEGFPEVAEEVSEEVVEILQEASGKGIQRIDLSGRRLRYLPEAFGHIKQLMVLNLSSNLLEVKP